MQRYTEREKDFLKAYIPGHSYRETVEAFSEEFRPVSMDQVIGFAKYYGIYNGLTRGFEKGHTPYNKGKKIPLRRDFVENQFKPGHRPANTHPVGYEQVLKSGRIKVKIAEPRTWKLKHRLIWEEHHGELPEDYVVVFKDGDNTNLDPDNLDALPKAVNFYINKLRLNKHTAEEYETVKLIASIMYERKKKCSGKKPQS